jgi:putative adenylate-forming enzyme
MHGFDKLSIATHFISACWRWQSLRGPALERYQEQRARQIVVYTRQHSPFYRAHWAGHASQQWRTLPTVEKHLMMENFDTFNTLGIRRDTAMEIAIRAERDRDFRPSLAGLTVGLSSGTSGHRGLFLVSREEQAAWAGTILARTLHRIPLRPLRVAFFLRSNSNLYEQVGGRLIHFRYFDLMLPLVEAVAALNTLQPQIIVGPPSLLGFLASERASGCLRARPERLISVAEVLEEQDRQRIEATFQAAVHQIYQCTEGLLAVSCERGSLHIQEDAVILQFEPLPGSNGERVMPVVTDMWRKTQPIIRYRLNDVLQLEPRPCACGSPFQVIRSIEGRCDDICYFESLTGATLSLRPFYPDTIRRMILLASQGITDYQVIQRQPGQLDISLSIAPGTSFESVSASVLESVNATVAQYECRPALVRIEQGIPPPPPGVKRRRVQGCMA